MNFLLQVIRYLYTVFAEFSGDMVKQFKEAEKTNKFRAISREKLSKKGS